MEETIYKRTEGQRGQEVSVSVKTVYTYFRSNYGGKILQTHKDLD